MAKLTPEERAELEARLAEDDQDDQDDEVEIGRGDGSYFRGKYSRALKLGYVTEPARKDDEGGKDKDKSGTVKRFQSGRRVS